ncbi:sulfatase-like hydrolase/transferase [Spirillospora albida]|uniref:sulfatase-like hydrolase/transferase n=1 Tax=Spirillospora albida TaxID=58123 RepID=UPI0012F8C47F|nr:sulfatase-like hydrolase/transferase [Spirillospora albida]
MGRSTTHDEPRHDAAEQEVDTDDGPEEEPRGRLRSVLAGAVTVTAAVLVLAALLTPIHLSAVEPGTYLRIPVEALLLAALVLVLPPRARRPLAITAGAFLGVLTIVKALDMGFLEILVRPFNPVLDWMLARPAVEFLTSSFGRTGGIAAAVGIGLLAVALIAAMALAVLRLTTLMTRHRTAASRSLVVLCAAWIVLAALGAQAVPGAPLAAKSNLTLVYNHARQVKTTIGDRERFAALASVDAFRNTPGDRLLTALRGKDVVLTFVESYGRTALDDPAVTSLLADGTRRLGSAGYSSRSGFLTSSVTGGGSWMAHATLLSGLPVGDQQRYRMLVSSDRLTLNGAFKRAGWRTTGIMPGVTRAWPEGRFYGYDKTYTSTDLGYRGPNFNWATMPDQYVLSAFGRLENGRPHAPSMAEIVLVSSHARWAAIPRFIDWNDVGDGSVYHRIPPAVNEAKLDPGRVRRNYLTSIKYSVGSLISYVEKYGDDDLVLVFLGDHQPAPMVAGENANRDVPITIVSRDKKVLDRIAAWNWKDGLNPAPDAPVWKMSDFRDRFLTAFGPTP